MTLTRRSLIMVLVGAACGDDGGFTPDDAQPRCEAACARSEMCEPATDEPQCVSDCTGTASWASESAFVQFTTCWTELPCSEPDVWSCTNDLPVQAYHAAYEDRCRERLADCGVGDFIINLSCDVSQNGLAGVIRLVAPAPLGEYQACFDEACDQIDACQTEVRERWGF